jgi:hypothetical protein
VTVSVTVLVLTLVVGDVVVVVVVVGSVVVVVVVVVVDSVVVVVVVGSVVVGAVVAVVVVRGAADVGLIGVSDGGGVSDGEPEMRLASPHTISATSTAPIAPNATKAAGLRYQGAWASAGGSCGGSPGPP